MTRPNRLKVPSALFTLALLMVLGCSGAVPNESPEWALAIHGGAGGMARDMPAEQRDAYLAGLESALEDGAAALAEGASALDVVERVVVILEENPLFNAGRGSVFTLEGGHELDAAIMDGRTRACGAVAQVTTVRNPVALARRVMEDSPHVFLAGPGAEIFAGRQGLELVDNSFFSTPERRQALERALERGADQAMQTVGAVARDRNGNLAAATSTGGRTAKFRGRIGDVPVIGAGTFADNASCAVSATGRGEQFIRHTVAARIAALVEHRGWDVRRAAEHVIHTVLEPGDGGVIVVGADGRVAMVFSTAAMFRGVADSTGRRHAAIWAEP